VNDSDAPFDVRFGGIAPPPLAHRLEKNGRSSELSCRMAYLLPGMGLGQRHSPCGQGSVPSRTSTAYSLPRDIFPGVEYHCEILCFNLRKLRPHYFLPDECL